MEKIFVFPKAKLHRALDQRGHDNTNERGAYDLEVPMLETLSLSVTPTSESRSKINMDFGYLCVQPR